jgi:signal transduction histidine kinase
VIATLGSDSGPREEGSFVLSNLPPTPAQTRLALGIVLAMVTGLYFVMVPYGGVHLGALHSFVAIYTTAMFVTDSITAILLYAQFSILRSRAILVIASGYFFTALLIIPYVLAFPGVLAPNGVVGGLQTTAQLYLLSHCGLPLFVIGYALSKGEGGGRRDAGSRLPEERVGAAIFRAVAWTAIGATVTAVLCITDRLPLPRLMLDPFRFIPEWPWVVAAPIASLCTLALVLLWFRRRSILDLFLMVVMCAYLIELPPQYYPSPERFSTGWYAVRVTSFLSSTILLIVLLYEIMALYGGALGSVLRQRRERDARLLTGDAVAASIAHEVRQPLTAMVTTADAGVRFLDRPTPNLERAMEAFRNIASDGHRAGAVIANLRANFKTGARERTSFGVDPLIKEVLALERHNLKQHRVLVHSTPNRELPAVRGSRIQILQVLLNLITNAIDAMAAKDGPRLLTIKAEAYEADRVVVSVADTGAGIDAEHSDHIFNPLFTTKSDGMGLGLSICRAIIEAHEGQLWVTPNSPRGAVFRFTLFADVANPPPEGRATPPS